MRLLTRALASSVRNLRMRAAIVQLDAGARWEVGVRQLASLVLEPAGFRVVKVSRAPYLCQGDTGSSFYVLDDALFVLAPV